LRIFFLAYVICFAAVAPAADEITIAREALRDGLWEIARTHAEKVVTNDAAKLIILESYAGERRWQDVKTTLAGWDDVEGAAFDYYRSIVKGDHAAAMRILKEGGSMTGYFEGRLYEAERLAEKGDRSAAELIWREVLAVTNLSDRALCIAATNLNEIPHLRRAYLSVRDVVLRRKVGLHLGTALLDDPKTFADGCSLITGIVRDFPSAEGASLSYLAMADHWLAAGKWSEALAIYDKAMDYWPEIAKISSVHEGRGWALQNMGRLNEALEQFLRAYELAAEGEPKAIAAMKAGDILSDLGRSDEALEKYRLVLRDYAKTTIAQRLKDVMNNRELEAKGRSFYKESRFNEAKKVFEDVAASDASRRDRMNFYVALCLYGQGKDDEAGRFAERIIREAKNASVRLDATLWLAKLNYNRREWKTAGRYFNLYAAESPESKSVHQAFLWGARAAFADGDMLGVIQLVTKLIEAKPDSDVVAAALLLQGEALVELSRFDEAVLILERLEKSESASSQVRQRAQILRADALFAMGADNSSRYNAAFESYNSLILGGGLTSSDHLILFFKLARCLEKLNRIEQALDVYYTQVVLRYRALRAAGEHISDGARAVFSRAAFRLADEYERRGKDRQSMAVLELVAESDVPAAVEARRRITKLSNKGRFL